jgi:hypothetical protein
MDAHTNLVGHKQWCCLCGQGQSRGRCTTRMPIASMPQSMESASQNPKRPKMGHTPCDLASDARYWTHYNTTRPCTSYLSLKTVIRLPRVTTKACGALTIEKLSARGENRYYPPQQPGDGQTGTKISLAPSHSLPECSPDMYKS